MSYSNGKRIPRSGEERERIGFYSIGINILLVGIKYGLAEMLAHIEPKPYNIEIFDHHYLSLVKASGYETPDF